MSPDKWERWEMQSSSFDPGRMAEEEPATEEQPSKKAKTWASTVDTSTVHTLNFTDKVSWEKVTHPDAAFPLSKPKEVLYIKPLQLENWQTKVKTDYWGLLMNPPKGLEGLAAEPAFSDRHERSLSCRKVRLIAR